MYEAYTAPAFRFRHGTRVRLNRWRVRIDVIGLTVVNLFGPWLWTIPWLRPVLQVYPILATFVILTAEPQRLPEFSTTRQKQRAAWRFAITRLPALAAIIALIVWVDHMGIAWGSLNPTGILGMLVSSYCAELFWRNILQPKLRQTGLGATLSIGLQAVLFAVSFAIRNGNVGVVLTALVVGAFNGWISHRYRTLWPGFTVLSIWEWLFL